MQIKIEYQDRYEQAGTYGQLGNLAREQEQWKQASEYYTHALKIFVDYEDDYYIGVVLRNLALLWQASNDAGLVAAVAEVLGASVEETEALLRKMLEGE